MNKYFDDKKNEKYEIKGDILVVNGGCLKE